MNQKHSRDELQKYYNKDDNNNKKSKKTMIMHEWIEFQIIVLLMLFCEKSYREINNSVLAESKRELTTNTISRVSIFDFFLLIVREI